MQSTTKKVVSMRFYQRSKNDETDVRVTLYAEGKRYGGSMRLLIPKSDFDKLNPDGSGKKGIKNPPRLLNGILISDILVAYRDYVIAEVKKKIAEGGINDDYFRNLLYYAREQMFRNLKKWATNLEWNKRIYLAAEKGKLDDFYKKLTPQMWRERINWEEVDNAK